MKALNLKSKPRFDFVKFVSGKAGLIFALGNSIIFLMTNYSGLLNLANPYAEGLLTPHPLLATLLFIQESFFFGSATIIVMIQAQKLWIKFSFCFMEGLSIFLYLNKRYLDKWLEGFIVDGGFILSTFIALFSMFALFLLGIILLNRIQQEEEYKKQLQLIENFTPAIPFKIHLNGQAKEGGTNGKKKVKH